MKALQSIWNKLYTEGKGSDKGDVHSYIPVYEEILAPYKETAKNVLEIGLFNGHSLLMWERYFTNAKVHGIDCDEQPHGGMADLRPMIAEGTHNIHIMDAEDFYKVAEAFQGVKFDVIIEDAGHSSFQQFKLYEIFKKYLSKDGVYIIEDIQDLDKDFNLFINFDTEKEVLIIDRRHIKNRYDDVLVIIKDKA